MCKVLRIVPGNKGNNKGSLSLLLLLFDRRITEGTKK